jgi:predicted nucleic acid-binding Zn ribbon protein
MRRRRAPRQMGEAFERVAERVMPQTLLAEVQRAWPAAAGPALAASAEPVSERDGVVTVACGAAVWAQELDLMAERVAAALNDELGRPAVLRIRAVATPPRH